MTQLDKLKILLESPDVSDTILEFYLDNAKDIICDLRNTDDVESQYYSVQLRMAIEMFNKAGAEGQTAHNENGISRTYEVGDISQSLLGKITPQTRTPFSTIRIINT